MSEPNEKLLEEAMEKVIGEMFAARGESSGTGEESEGASDGAPSAVLPRPKFVAPDTVGPYPVTGVIGEGGLGVILRATDNKLGRKIAIKLLRKELSDDPAIVEQFRSEARMTGNMQHPGIVPIHDVGRTESGQPYFVMKIIEGQTLKAMLDRREFPGQQRQRLLRTFEKVCDTVAFAHTRGLVHRDLKPANIMVGAFGEVQVLDWGLAGKRHQSVELGSDPPGGGEDPPDEYLQSRIFGTPAYMAPEQARGALAMVDARSDVFALGAILTEILTGAPAYVAESPDEVYLKARRAWLDDAYARLEACDVEPRLRDLAQRCVAEEIERRPVDATVVAGEVDAFLAWRDERANELKVEAAEARGRARLVMAVSAAIAVIAIGVVGWLWSRSQAQATVAQAMQQALVLAEAAGRGAPGRPETFNDAISATEQVVTVSTWSAEVRQEATELLSELRARQQQSSRDRAFLEWDEKSRMRYAYGIEVEGVLDEFQMAFRDWGLDLHGPVAPAAAFVRQSPIREQIIGALDAYSFDVRVEDDGGVWRKMLAIAIAVDEDPWQSAVREAVLAADAERLRELSRSSEGSGASAEALDLLARGLLRQSHYASFRRESIRMWRQAVAKSPDNDRIVRRLEQQLWHFGAPLQEILWLNLLGVTLRPDSKGAWHHLASAFRVTGQPDLAAQAANQATAIDPEYRITPAVDLTRARVLKSQGFSLEALIELRHIAASNPGEPDALRQLAGLWYTLHDAVRSVGVYRELLTRADSPSTRCNFGLALALAGDFDAAIAELERGREMGEKVPNWNYDVETRFLVPIRNLRELAKESPESDSQRVPMDPSRRARVGAAALLRKKPWTALQHFRQAFAEEPTLGRDCLQLARPFGSCFRVLAAVAAVDAATGTTGESAKLSTETRERCLDQALDLLRGELGGLDAAYPDPAERVYIRRALAKLLKSPHFAAVRPGEGLEVNVERKRRGVWVELWNEIEARYHLRIEGVAPDAGTKNNGKGK